MTGEAARAKPFRSSPAANQASSPALVSVFSLEKTDGFVSSGHTEHEALLNRVRESPSQYLFLPSEFLLLNPVPSLVRAKKWGSVEGVVLAADELECRRYFPMSQCGVVPYAYHLSLYLSPGVCVWYLFRRMCLCLYIQIQSWTTCLPLSLAT